MAIRESDMMKRMAPITGIKPKMLPVVSHRSSDVLTVAEHMRKYSVPAFRTKSGTSGPEAWRYLMNKIT